MTLSGAAGEMMMLETFPGVTVAAGQRRDFMFKSPESLRPRTFLLDLNEKKKKKRKKHTV